MGGSNKCFEEKYLKKKTDPQFPQNYPFLSGALISIILTRQMTLLQFQECFSRHDETVCLTRVSLCSLSCFRISEALQVCQP